MLARCQKEDVIEAWLEDEATETSDGYRTPSSNAILAAPYHSTTFARSQLRRPRQSHVCHSQLQLARYLLVRSYYLAGVNGPWGNWLCGGGSLLVPGHSLDDR